MLNQREGSAKMLNHLPSFSSIAAPEEVRRQLDKLLARHWFARSERMCRFLRFGVERALAGTGSPIKEYIVGVEGDDGAANYDRGGDAMVGGGGRRVCVKVG